MAKNFKIFNLKKINEIFLYISFFLYIFALSKKVDMKNKYLLKKFIGFLKQKEIYDDYLYALSKGEYYRFNYNKNWIKAENFIIESIQCDPSDLISMAFDWHNFHPTAFRKWWEINDEWEDIIYKKINII